MFAEVSTISSIMIPLPLQKFELYTFVFVENYAPQWYNSSNFKFKLPHPPVLMALDEILFSSHKIEKMKYN